MREMLIARLRRMELAHQKEPAQLHLRIGPLRVPAQRGPATQGLAQVEVRVSEPRAPQHWHWHVEWHAMIIRSPPFRPLRRPPGALASFLPAPLWRGLALHFPSFNLQEGGQADSKSETQLKQSAHDGRSSRAGRQLNGRAPLM
jgi:hypothetical protein